jgi:hypothetical protein
MAGYIEVGSQTGNTVYAMLRNAQKQVWNGSTWVAYNVANWSQYVIALTEDTSSGFYTAAVPAGINTAIRLTILVYQQLGGSPAAGDDFIGNATGIYDGANWETGWSTNVRTLTSLPAAGVDVTLINGSAVAAQRLAISAANMPKGKAVTGTLTVSQFTTDLSFATNDILYGRVVYWTTGNLVGQVAAIAAYDGATKKITVFQPMVAAPANNDEFIIL